MSFSRFFTLFCFARFDIFCGIQGDAIKSVKPYFGLGVNTAFEDCIQLDRCGGLGKPFAWVREYTVVAAPATVGGAGGGGEA